MVNKLRKYAFRRHARLFPASIVSRGNSFLGKTFVVETIWALYRG